MVAHIFEMVNFLLDYKFVKYTRNLVIHNHPLIMCSPFVEGPICMTLHSAESHILCIKCSVQIFRAVAMPETLRACELGLNLDKRIVRFTVPFSVTLSANGSAVFIVCSCLFISNIAGIPPTAGTIFTIGYEFLIVFFSFLFTYFLTPQFRIFP